MFVSINNINFREKSKHPAPSRCSLAVPIFNSMFTSPSSCLPSRCWPLWMPRLETVSISDVFHALNQQHGTRIHTALDVLRAVSGSLPLDRGHSASRFHVNSIAMAKGWVLYCALSNAAEFCFTRTRPRHPPDLRHNSDPCCLNQRID